MLERSSMLKALLILTMVAAATLGYICPATAAVDSRVVGSWWQTGLHSGRYAGLLLRADGSCTHAAFDDPDREWDAGTFSASGGSMFVTIQQASDPTHVGQTMSGTYSVVGSQLTIHFTGDEPETYQRVASYAGLPSGVVGQWLQTRFWENGVEQPIDWVSRATVTNVGIVTNEELSEGVELDFWGLVSVNSARTELTQLVLYTADPTEGLPIGPMQMGFSLTANNMEVRPSPTERIRMSRLQTTVDSNLVGTWVETDYTQLAQVGPAVAPDFHSTSVIDSNGDYFSNDVANDQSWWVWERGSAQTTADGYLLLIFTASDPEDRGASRMLDYHRTGDELTVDGWEEEEGETHHIQGTFHSAHLISGHILDSSSQPVEGVIIEADSGKLAVTDDNGFYELGLINDGQYTLTPSHANWSFAPATRPASVPPDRTGLDFTATVPAYEISGIVQDDDDNPVEGARVELFPPGGGESVVQTTGADGRFSFTGLAAGTYPLEVTKEDWEFDWVDPLTVPPDQTDVVVTGEQTAFEISGRVVNAEDNGIEGVIIDYNGDGTTVNPDGSFRLRHLDPGQYILLPHKDGIVFDPANAIVTVAPDRTDLVFVGSVTITGHVEGNSPLADVVIAISESSSGTPLGTATTGADGNYTAAGLLPVAQYLVVPTKDGYIFDPLGRTLNLGPNMVADFDGTAGTTYSISGTIDDGTNLLEGVVVRAETLLVSYQTTTNSSGYYELIGLPEGSYTVTPILPGYDFDPASQQVQANATDVNFTGTPMCQHTFATGQRMIGIPVDLSGSPTIEDIVGVDAVWWDSQGTGYITLTEPTPYVLGRGYWAQFAAATDVTIGAGSEVTGQFTYPVYNGWNIISSPYDYEVSLDSFTNAPTLRPFAWTYQGSGYELVASIADDPSAIHHSLQPWWGYWVLSDGEGTITMNPVTPSAQTVELLQIGEADADQGGWQIQLTAKAGSRVDLCNYCGVAAEQTAQALAIANPPLVSGSVDLYFPTETRPMATDIRPTSQDKLAWEFEVRTDLADTEVTVGYPDLSVVPSNCRLTLTDLDADKSVYMRTTHGYSYNSGPQGGIRHFRITAEPKSESSLLITGITTQQVSGQQAAITYNLSAAAQVDIQIRNIAGRVIRHMQSDKLQASGSHTANWNLANATGSRVPAGTYLCIITARTQKGQQASCLQPIALIR